MLQQGYAYVSQNKGVLNLTADNGIRSVGVPAQSLVDHLSFISTPMTRATVHPVDRVHDRGDSHRKKCRRGLLRPISAPHLCRRHLEWRLPSAAGARDCTRALRWRGRLGRDLCRSGGAEYLERAAPGNSQLSRLCRFRLRSDSTAAKNILADRLSARPGVGRNLPVGLFIRPQFWEVTLCQWQKRLDPSYDTYGSGTGTYSYVDRLSASDVGADVAAIATTGNIGKPLITVAGTMDALLPINLHARAYARAVTAALSEGSDEGRSRAPSAGRHTGSTRCRTATISRPTRTRPRRRRLSRSSSN